MRIIDALGDRLCGFTLLGFAIYICMLLGCAERAELREQQCAHRALEQYGGHPPAGVYGTWTYHDRCWARLWTGERVYEGRLTSDKWPE
jgi:hypothetical protein